MALRHGAAEPDPFAGWSLFLGRPSVATRASGDCDNPVSIAVCANGQTLVAARRSTVTRRADDGRVASARTVLCVLPTTSTAVGNTRTCEQRFADDVDGRRRNDPRPLARHRGIQHLPGISTEQ